MYAYIPCKIVVITLGFSSTDSVLNDIVETYYTFFTSSSTFIYLILQLKTRIICKLEEQQFLLPLLVLNNNKALNGVV